VSNEASARRKTCNFKFKSQLEYSPSEARNGCNPGAETNAPFAITRGKESGFVICRGGGDGDVASLGARLGVTRASLFVELS
jgi:hypothetical protein